MLTESNLSHYVSVQECRGPCGLLYLLGIFPDDRQDWTKVIGQMSIDDIINRLSDNYIAKLNLEIRSFAVACDLTLQQVLDRANYYLQSFPKTSGSILYAKAAIASQSRRDMGNRELGNIVFYRGEHSNIDACIAIAKYSYRGIDKYGIVKHPNFDQYGFVLV